MRLLRFAPIVLAFALFQCQPKNQTSGPSFPSIIEPQEGEKLASGFVFHDENENRKKDEGEKGISGVAVSNGVEVVITDSKGHYGLPTNDDAILFVVKPKDWQTPLNEEMLPQFYYLHKPNGSPKNFKYAGVAPTGDLPEEINFPLYPDESQPDYKMVVFGDPQPYNIEQVDFLAEDVISELVGRDDLKFGMTMGDIVGNDLHLFQPINQAVAKVGIPWYNVLGNHDMNFEPAEDYLSDETFERVYGPANYAFVYGDVHFVVVDDVFHYLEDSNSRYVGGLREDQLQFVENYLATVSTEDLIVLNMHIPLAQHNDLFRQEDQNRLFELLKDFPNTLSISAHTHTQNNTFFGKDTTGWKQETPHHHFNVGTTSGSWWTGMRTETDIPHTMMRDGTPNGYAFINFKGTDYAIEWKVAGYPKEYQMNIHVPRDLVAGKDSVPLTVNVFNGSQQTHVQYRVQGKTDWHPMTHTPMPDPYFTMMQNRWFYFQKHGSFKGWETDSLTQNQDVPGYRLPLWGRHNSTHIWTANLGKDWKPGRYLIEVKATNRYGQEFKDHYLLRMAE